MIKIFPHEFANRDHQYVWDIWWEVCKNTDLRCIQSSTVMPESSERNETFISAPQGTLSFNIQTTVASRHKVYITIFHSRTNVSKSKIL